MGTVSPLVSAEWLAEHLTEPDLRVLDCTVFLRQPAEPGGAVTRESGRAAWQAGHIPGAAFADLMTDLADGASSLPYMMPAVEQFAAAMERLGVGDGTRVVLYDRQGGSWATRVWWMLRSAGFDDAAVLDGGLRAWTDAGQPLSTDAPAYPPARFTARPRPGLWATKADVLAAMADGATCIVNALRPEQHRGEGNAAAYGRAGRIPGSVNVPAGHLADPETGRYKPLDELRALFAGAGVLDRPRIVTYCGGGIAASNDAFVLTLLGAENVAVYDASLSEWAKDPALPIEVG